MGGSSIAKKRFAHDPKSLANIAFVHQDILTLNPSKTFDVVVGNYFLNIFRTKLFVTMLDQLCTLTKPGGKTVFGDFCYPIGNCAAQAFCYLHQYTAYVTYAILGWNRGQIHTPHNLSKLLEAKGYRLDDVQYFS